MKSGAYGPLEFKVHQKQKNNLVDSYIEELEKTITFKEKGNFYFESKKDLTDKALEKNIENYLFCNIQSVIGESALVLAESDNLKKQIKENVTCNIFADNRGSTTHNYTVSKKRDTIIDHLCDVYGNDKTDLIRKIVNDNLDYKSEIQDYSAFRVMHGIIENTLSYLTGLSKSELDEARFLNLNDLVNKVKEALNNNSNLSEYITNQGGKGDELKNNIAQQMRSVIDIFRQNKDKNLFIRFVRNWNQDKELHSLMPVNNVPDDKMEILAFFGIKNNLSALEFKERKHFSIFKSLKNTYEKDGNISNIETSCNKAYDNLKKAEDERQKYYRKNIEPLENQLESYKKQNIPGGWYYYDRKIRPYTSTSQSRKEILDETTKRGFENQLNAIDDEIKAQKHSREYKELENKVDETRTKLINEFKKIKTEFSTKEKYLLADLRSFSDKYRYIEGNDQDYDALLRMGLCGNYVNHERIQGFNAVDLQHVAMLVDKESSFINDPPQLIQGPGRLRCLNRMRLSTLFCQSSEELKFDIESLKKGDYIGSYNEIMEKGNKKSPFEFGNEILKKINGLVEKGVSEIIKDGNKGKAKEIDGLAAEVIEQIISSFNITYNNELHDAKAIQDYFIEVLKRVTIEMEEKLKGQGVTVGNLDIEYKIRSIQSKIDKITDVKDKMDKNTKNQQDINEKLEIKGNIIKKLFVKLYRIIRRLICCRIELEKQRKQLQNEKVELEKEFKKESEDALKKEQAKLGEQLKLKPQKQEFIGILRKEENVSEKEITQQERENIIQKHKKENEKSLEDFQREMANLGIEIKSLEEDKRDKLKLEEKIVNLKKILSFEENTEDYDNHYTQVVNSVLAQRSISRNYDEGKVYWIQGVFSKFKPVLLKEYYKDHRENIEQHIHDCVLSQAFLELFSNIFVPLINSGTLLIVLNACYPGKNNSEKVKLVNEYYDILIKNQESEKINVDDIEQIIQYIETVQGHVAKVVKGQETYYNDAVLKANQEISRLEDKEALQVKSEIYDCILIPIQKGLANSDCSFEDWVQNNPSQQEKVAFASQNVGMKLYSKKVSSR